MFRLFRLSVTVIALVGGLPASSQAALVTWQSSGLITWVLDEAGALPGLVPGTPYSLEFVVDTDAPALRRGASSFIYDNAIRATTFRLGEWEYTHTVGDVFVNYEVPGHSGLGGPGLVQFHWQSGWSNLGPDAPNLNFGLGLLTASYNDVNAVDGRLPLMPHIAPTQGGLSDLTFWGSLGMYSNEAQFDTAAFQPTAVPEPGTLSLLALGAAAGWRAHRRSRTLGK